ncbi:MAG TPA: hypothetical protein DD400_01075 [Rhodospirillaceae bacterium]|nr:hypothetical protein [Rhodospirillaceae bacterium]
MIGFRFAQSGSRNKGAHFFGAIGKRKIVNGVTIPFVPPPPPSQCLAAVNRKMNDPPPSLDAEPSRPIPSDIAEMWEDYHVFKAAGMLQAWCRKWAAYLPHPS